MDVNIIVLAGFSLFMFLTLRFGYRKAIKGLDQKIDEIRQALDQAETTRQKALTHLQAEQQLHATTLGEVDITLQKKKKELAALHKLAENDLDNLLESRQSNADLVFDKIRLETIQQIKENLSDVTIDVIQHLAQHQLDTEIHEHFNTHAIEKISASLMSGKTVNSPIVEPNKSLASMV